MAIKANEAESLLFCLTCFQKLTPVFPWEVERVKPHLVTLVDDLMDRMKVFLRDNMGIGH